MEIYYDPTDGVLMAQNHQGEWDVVKTNAQLDPQRIALDAKGFMYIAGLDGVAHVVKDFDENPISLKGPEGLEGPAGKPGTKFIVPTNEFIDGRINLMQPDDIQHGDYTISVDSQTMWAWDADIHRFKSLFTLKGEKGDPGEPGSVGTQGPQGMPGKQGAPGNDGKTYIPTVDLDGTLFWKIDEPTEIPQSVNIKGPKGDVGEKGDMGEKGADGLTFTPSISEDGVLSWTNSGNVSNPQPISIKGPKGDQGETGAQGPQGEKGEKGETGPQGIQGEQGPQGEKGADGQTPVFEISDGSLKYKIGEQDWTNLITDKSIFTQPDVQTVLPENPTHGQIILWEGDPSMGIDVRFTPGCKYKYLAAGTIQTKTRLLGKSPNDVSYTVFKANSSDFGNLKKEILQSDDKVVTLAGTYGKAILTEGVVTFPSLQTIYTDGGSMLQKITDSDKVKALIDTNPTETHWAVVELEEVLESGTWIQIS